MRTSTSHICYHLIHESILNFRFQIPKFNGLCIFPSHLHYLPNDAKEPIDNFESRQQETSPIEERIIIDEADKIAAMITETDEWCQKAFGLKPEEFAFNNEGIDGFVDVTREMILSRVLGDAFHVMDRVKVPINHCYKAAYFMALREAMFILNPQDVKNLRECYNVDDKGWQRMLAFNFSFIAKRVRRRIPPPTILHARVKAVYDYFQDKTDFATGAALFHDRAKHKSKNILKMITNGLISDPPGVSFYVKLLDENGCPKLDSQGLQLYRSIRGTSLVESFHELLTRSFGHTQAGAFYSDSLLTLVRHYHNWRASLRNRPNFPRLRHYDGEAIDVVNELYEYCFGTPKYPQWLGTNDGILPREVSPYGVVPSSEDENILFSEGTKPIKTSRDYIAFRQGTDIAYLPVYGENDYKLFSELMKEAIKNGNSLNSKTTFATMAEKWNEIALGDTNKIYGKLEVHLARHYKRWQQNQSKREAISKVCLKSLLKTLQRTLPLNGMVKVGNETMEVDPLHLDAPLPNPLDEGSPHDDFKCIYDEGGQNDLNTNDGNTINDNAQSSNNTQMTNKKGKRRKTNTKHKKPHPKGKRPCTYSTCPTKESCTGGYGLHLYCETYKKDHPNDRRVGEKRARSCGKCGEKDCRGCGGQKYCQYK